MKSNPASVVCSLPRPCPGGGSPLRLAVAKGGRGLASLPLADPRASRQRPSDFGVHQGATRILPGTAKPDLLARGCGCCSWRSSGLWCAAVGVAYAHRDNWFWSALLSGGFIDHPIRVADGISPADRDYFNGRGLDITSLIARAADRRLTPERASQFATAVLLALDRLGDE